MATAPTFTKTGTKAASTTKLAADVFAVMPKDHTLLRQAYETHASGARPNLAIVKTRGLVSGGGKKPWRQKGTGRARVGSSRNPVWRGGGIAFGPTGNENYVKQLNTKAKRLAIRQALSLAAADNNLLVVEAVESKDGKTGELAKLLSKLGTKGRVLLVVDQKTKELMRAAQNVPELEVIGANYLNVRSLMNADSVVVTKSSLDVISQWLGGAK